MSTHPSVRTITPDFARRTFLGLSGASALAVTLAACGEGGGGGGPQAREEVELALPTYAAPPEVPGGIVSDVEGMPVMFTEPFQEYFDSVEAPPLSGGEVSTFQVLWGAPPRDKPDNEYWVELEERLGGTFAPTLVAFDTYNEKMATTIASGDIPDLLFVQDSNAVAAKAIDDGVFADLSEVLAGDNILEWPNLANVGTNAWKASAKNGHIFGVPNEDPYISQFPAIRWDAMEAAGFDEMPEDAEGFLEMMTAIAELGELHGKPIYGIGAFEGRAQAMVEQMFRAGTTWQLDGDGNLINIIETDVYEQVLDFQNRMWQAGVYHPDALALASQGNQAAEMFTNGQSCIWTDAFQGFFGSQILNDVAELTPGAEARLFVPPAFDSGDIVVQRNDGYWGMVAISAKAAEDPERLKELLGVINYWRAPDASTEARFIHSGVEGWNWDLGDNNELVGIDDPAAQADRAALQWLGAFKSPSYTIAENNLPYVDNFREVAETLIPLSVPNVTVGLYNEAVGANGAAMSEVDTDYRGGIVSGRMPLSALEDYREAWRAAGGDAVRDEYQAALDAQA
ncbi:hypothetical protein Bcav_4040 [Beutenbergia cavernae DSM 12333]|uniref:Extracellular solute-binding protein family 1 n=1 Tax=Beutenbergia cavernae (strain ATCC BAA-8 / DSM 12333 / CCUG 43141 / JCM 11478 / NBRC 16432 / NCIMB 13614 / HKI 0122) TaxID=471853 RepID=C5C5E1_BEUC1|nr:extracellular solute-binding protein [Beutenbergia cavernae]ACQ82281.1 hypothetical protein Bcav_4040 [Beutenbergia cavernae DSM 12333]